MTTFHSPKLTVIDESEINFNEPDILGLAVLVKIPHLASAPFSSTNINRHTIIEAIQQQAQITIPLHKISLYGPDYLLIADSPSAATQIINKLSINIDMCSLGLLPWTVDYGATTIDIDSRIPTVQTTPHQIQLPGNNQELDIRVLGLPPHLCSEEIVRRLFTNICHVTDIDYSQADLTYSFKTYAPTSAIPDIAHIAVQTKTPTGLQLHIWQLWYEIMTLDMHAGERQIIHQPVDGKTASIALSSHTKLHEFHN